MTQVHFTLKQAEIQKLLEDSVKDAFSLNILTTVFNRLMEQQRDEYIGAGEYERSEGRVSHRNGYYEREFTMGVGTLSLRVPRTRDGLFSPDLFERYQRNEKALIASMLEMYITGVSTRKVSQVVEALCGKKVSKSFVSNLTQELDPIVKAWQYSSLAGSTYPYLMVDVMYIKVREDHRVVSKSCHVAIGFSDEGSREVLGFLIQEGESEETWVNFFNYLKARELGSVELVTSDAHAGLVNAIKQCFTGASWQRCQVHFMRNIFSQIPKKGTQSFREQVKALFRLNNVEDAREEKKVLMDRFAEDKKYEKACEILDEGIEDAFQYAVVGKGQSRIRSTNLLERLNQELRRREKVIRIFPNIDSATRLLGSILMDIHESWISSPRAYMKN